MGIFGAVHLLSTKDNPVATPDSEAFVQTFARGLQVIEVMGSGNGPQTLAAIASASQIPRTAVRRFLLTLVNLDFVRSDGKQYWLTPKVLRLGMSYLYNLPFWRQSQLVLEELCSSVGQSCAVSVLDDEDIVYVARVHARRILSMSPVLGSRLPAHAVSMGRVLLAALDDDRLSRYLEQVQLRRLTFNTLVDRDTLGQRIQRVRDQGYAWIDRELDDSICGVAVPIRGAGGDVVAAINISLQAGEATEQQAVAAFVEPLRQAAARIRSTMVLA
jgi:IclR family pca regulon transcriptional regulator